MTFRLDYHNKILTILKSFNSELLKEAIPKKTILLI